MLEVKAKAPKKDNKEAIVTVDIGENVQEAIEKFGEAVVFSNYSIGVRLAIQANMRRYLEAGLSQEDIQKKFEGYKPGVAMERVADPLAAAARALEKMSDTEREAAFEALRAKLLGGNAAEPASEQVEPKKHSKKDPRS